MIKLLPVSPDEVAERLEMCMPELAPERYTKPTDINIDSLDLVTFLCAVDEEFSVRVTAEQFEHAITMDALYRAIAEQINETR